MLLVSTVLLSRAHALVDMDRSSLGKVMCRDADGNLCAGNVLWMRRQALHFCPLRMESGHSVSSIDHKQVSPASARSQRARVCAATASRCVHPAARPARARNDYVLAVLCRPQTPAPDPDSVASLAPLSPSRFSSSPSRFSSSSSSAASQVPSAAYSLTVDAVDVRCATPLLP